MTNTEACILAREAAKAEAVIISRAKRNLSEARIRALVGKCFTSDAWETAAREWTRGSKLSRTPNITVYPNDEDVDLLITHLEDLGYRVTRKREVTPDNVSVTAVTAYLIPPDRDWFVVSEEASPTPLK